MMKMNKTKILLTLLSVMIIVLPLAVQVLAYQDNLIGLIIPPEIANMANGSSNSSSIANLPFQPPQIVKEPEYNPETKTATFTFNFTNPLKTEMSVKTLEAGVKCHDHDVMLGNVSIGDSLTLIPGQSVEIQALGQLSDEAVNHFLTQHASSNNVNVDFSNLNVEFGGVQIQLDEQNIGWIPIPQQFYGWK
jgi:hypothetical protein